MRANAFIGKTVQPSDDELTAALGPARALWDQLLADLAEDGLVAREWNSYSRKAGWTLRLKRGKRNIVYLSPSRNCFTASFALGDKALGVARVCGIPPRVIKTLDEATRYAEGTAVRIDVTEPEDVMVVRKLASVKLEN